MANKCLTDYTLSGITFDCNPNLAGIKDLYITYYDEVAGKVDESGDTHTITELPSGVTWYRYAFAKNTSALNSTLTKDDANGVRYYTNTISLVFSKMEAYKHLEVMAMAAEKLAVIVVDNNNKAWYVGFDSYVSASEEEAGTGASFDDRNGYTVTLEGTSAFLPFEYVGDLPTA